MKGSEGASLDILGVEVTPTVVRAVRLKRVDRKVVRAAECSALASDEAGPLDPSTLGPALDEVLYQLDVVDRADHLAAVTIGPARAGVGSGPALPGWLEHRARQLGENLVCSGKLGIAFCPQRALDTAIMICEQANITVSRIDFAPVAACRVLPPGAETMSVGSSRGWRARLRDDEVLEAVESSDVAADDPLTVVDLDGGVAVVESLHGVTLSSDVKSSVGDDIGRFAVAVGAAVGIVDGSSANLLDGETIRGRRVPSAFVAEVGGVTTGEIAGSRTTMSLARGSVQSQARSVIRQVPPESQTAAGSRPRVDNGFIRYGAEPDEVDSGRPVDDVGREGGRPAGDIGYYRHRAGGDARSRDAGAGARVGEGYAAAGRPGYPTTSISPDLRAQAALARQGRGRGIALVVAGLILFSVAIAIGILVTQG